jgi:hypothetical protein
MSETVPLLALEVVVDLADVGVIELGQDADVVVRHARGA